MSNSRILEFKLREHKDEVENMEEASKDTMTAKEKFYKLMEELQITEIEDIVELMTRYSIRRDLIFDSGLIEMLQSLMLLYGSENGIALDEDWDGEWDEDDEEEDEEEEDEDWEDLEDWEDEDWEDLEDWEEEDEDWEDEDEEEDDEDFMPSWDELPFLSSLQKVRGGEDSGEGESLIETLESAREVYQHFGGQKPELYEYLLWELDRLMERMD